MSEDILPAIDRTALSFWFPFIKAAGLPVPRTRTFAMPLEAQKVIWFGFDGKDDGGDALVNFAVHVTETVLADGYRFPLFLRTDHTSGKHDWNRTCFVTMHEEMASHMYAIAEFSEMASMIGGLPWDTWAVREMLPTIPLGVCPHYRDMPVCREFRVFVEGDEVICLHPYWPPDSLLQGGCAITPGAEAKLFNPTEVELAEIRSLASRAGAAVGGKWSVDILETERGWFVTDMAEAHKSYHWPTCPKEGRMRTVPA